MNTSCRKVVLPPTSGRNTANEINPARALVHSAGFGTVVLALAHPFLALAMRSSSLVATVHALLTVAIGLSFALFSKDIRKVAYAAAYIAGAEVLWRMTNAHIFWEAGKYITILVLGIAVLRIKPWKRPALPVSYFLLLCLSIPLTISALGFSGAAKDAISFNLSGPLALMICALYFSQITLDQNAIRRLAWWLVVPILGIATLALSGTLSAGQIVFTDESNFATSGGFGPNQVSAILGLGGGLALILLLTGKGLVQRFVSFVLAVGLLALSALTFSRGGLYNAGLMLALAIAHYLRSARGRMTALVALVVLGLAGGYLVFPRINSFTGGMLGARFSNLDPTRRIEIAQVDLELWFANPVLGVGPGMAQQARSDILGVEAAAHTEYTRLLAEHGTGGLLALLILLIMGLRTYRRASTREAEVWVVALLAWPLMEMSHAAMRVVAISFLFGLAMADWHGADAILEPAGNQEVGR